jgi:fibronectin-binding autotransporter adhesin
MLWWVLGCGAEKPVVGPPAEEPEDSGSPPVAVDQDQDGFPEDEDCDDGDAAVYPGAPDLCGDEKVTDCERINDDGLVTLDGTEGFSSLQVALDRASSGSELLLCSGIYVGTFQASVPVRLVAHTGPEDTALEGSGSGPVLALPGGSALEGLTVRQGNAQQGGGILQTSAGSLTVSDCVVEQNTAQLGGGLALAEGGTALLVDTLVHHNYASQGGGGIYVPPAALLELTGTSEVFENTSDVYGGGIYVRDGQVLGGLIHQNQTAGSLVIIYEYGVLQYTQPIGGGGLASAGASTVTGVELRENSASLGGGLSVTGGTLLIVDSVVADNQGGGVFAVGSALELAGTSTISDNAGWEGGGGALIQSQLLGGLVTGNVATSGGGGLHVYDGAVSGTVVEGNEAPLGGGILAEVAELEGVTVRGNTAEVGGGLAARVHPEMAGGVRIVASTVEDNEAIRGGGLHSAVETQLSETQLVGNTAEVGGGWYQEGNASITGGTLQDNVAADGGGGLYTASGRFEATDTTFLDNTPDDVSSGGESYTVPGGEIACIDGICALP